ncbi:aldolase [Paenibacillus sp. SSG-1]|uniref:aldolase n=1 Tax=Paenibacillus sp. SSG-1 TaxID=1443669 RepID=UPI000B7E1C04|nr:aldolase [Paenibacillus sp. SSG-1]OXL82129.1 aldolase [Paenibacillus sp. SSG-1]
MIKPAIYTAFGLRIESEIPLPELRPALHFGQDIQVRIGFADLDDAWAQRETPVNKFAVSEQQVMFRIPKLAVFSAENGTDIYVSPEAEADEDQIRLYVLGTCMGAILMQRRILPLHGSAVVMNGKAYALVGHSGHGKSTLASALLQQGCQLLTDDVIAVTMDSEQIPLVAPAYPQQKLWQDSLDTFGMDAGGLRPLFDRETKYAVPVLAKFASEPIPLAGVFELVKTDCEQPEIREIGGLERLPLLYRHTYRSSLLAESGLTPWHFECTTRLSGSVNMYQLQRPLDQPTIGRLTEMVLDVIGG